MFKVCFLIHRELQREKREKQQLLQGIPSTLPIEREAATEALPVALSRPTQPPEHEHDTLVVEQPPNTAGEAIRRGIKRTAIWPAALGRAPSRTPSPAETKPTSTVVRAPSLAETQPVTSLPKRITLKGAQGDVNVEVFELGSVEGSVSQQFQAKPAKVLTDARSRTSDWYHYKCQKEDSEREQKGEAPKRRYLKHAGVVTCKKCKQARTEATNHTQYKGNQYCPGDSSLPSFEEWKARLVEKYSKT